MADSQPFAIRGTNFNMVVLQLRAGAPEVVLPALERLIQQSPAFLRDSPVVLGLDDLTGGQADFAGLAEGLRKLRLVPIGTIGGSGGLRQAAAAAGLAQLSKGQQLFKSKDEPPAHASAPPAAAPVPPPTSLSTSTVATAAVPDAATSESATAKGLPALVVTQPMRAGARIYAKDRDVICTATVNAGAEIIADGHVHIYGALRGRAIAGASGFNEARIFTLNFDPELVAIAGLYRVREDLDPALIGQRLQVSLHGDEMRLTPFG
jgi:septum site-determining protein MinC